MQGRPRGHTYAHRETHARARVHTRVGTNGPNRPRSWEQAVSLLVAVARRFSESETQAARCAGARSAESLPGDAVSVERPTRESDPAVTQIVAAAGHRRPGSTTGNSPTLGNFQSLGNPVCLSVCMPALMKADAWFRMFLFFHTFFKPTRQYLNHYLHTSELPAPC